MAADRKRDRNKRPGDAGSKTKKQLVIVGLLIVGLVLAVVTQPEKAEVVAAVQPTANLRVWGQEGRTLGADRRRQQQVVTGFGCPEIGQSCVG